MQNQLQACKTVNHLKPLLARTQVNGLLRQSTILFQLVDFLSLSQNTSFLIYATLLVDTEHHRHPTSSSFLYNTLIKGYSGSQFPEQGIITYIKMLRNHCKPDNFTFPFLVKTVGSVGTSRKAIREGKVIHGQIVSNGFEANVFVVNTLIGMYSVYREMESAQKVFDRSSNLDIVSWNSLIDGYVKLGVLDMARKLFDKMPERNDVSWTAMISGVREGWVC